MILLEFDENGNIIHFKPKIKNNPKTRELITRWEFTPEYFPEIKGEYISFGNCFKIEKENAKAMIEGFKKDDKIIHQCIYCFGRHMPAGLIITNKNPSRFPLSRIGRNLDADEYTIDYKYVAHVVAHYPIINTIELWDELCSNGLFDIWNPSAPFLKYNENIDPSKFTITLLRVYELETTVPEDLVTVNARNASLSKPLMLKIKRPVISDSEFNQIKDKLEASIKKMNML